jgi:hypothetical protein
MVIEKILFENKKESRSLASELPVRIFRKKLLGPLKPQNITNPKIEREK